MAWIDPETYAMIQEILSAGGDPMLDEYDVYSQPWIGPQEDKTPGTLEAQNAQLTAMGKANTRFMDPAMILSLGSSMGGYAPEMFNPVTTYKPVQAQGQLLRQQMLNSQDPLERYIAGLSQRGMGPGAIQAEVQRVLADPNDDLHLAIKGSIPGTLSKDMQGKPVLDPEQPDYGYVATRVSALTDALASDTGQWDGVTVDETGAPAVAVEEDSDAMKQLREAGFSNTPYETYDPYLFAPEGVTPETDAATNAKYLSEAERGKKASTDNGAMNRALAKAMMGDQFNYNVPMPGPQQYGAERTAGAAGSSGTIDPGNIPGFFEARDQQFADYQRGMFGDRALEQNGGAVRSGAAPSPTRNLAGQARRTNQRNSLDVERIRGQAAEAQRKSMSAFADSRQAAAAELRAKAGGDNRQRLVEELLQMGFSPFADQNRARQANIWGG